MVDPAATAQTLSAEGTVPAEAPAPASGADGQTADDELAAMFGGMKKKKGSKKTAKSVAVDLDNLPASADDVPKEDSPQDNEDTHNADSPPHDKADGDATAAASAADDLFGDLKKKKKKSKKDKLAELDKALAEGGPADEEKAEFDENPQVNPFATDPDAEVAFLKGTDKYPYAWLLSRTFATLRENNPALSGDKKKYTMVPPVVEREGSKKTAFVNCADICRRMHRDHEHVQAFLFAELGTIGNEDGAGRLIIKGRFQQQQIQNVLRKYISEYVQCKTCRSADTELSRENRIYFVKCKTCGSQRSVAAIKTGFQAVVGKRSRMRAAA